MSLSQMDHNMAASNAWTGFQRLTLWNMGATGVRSVPGRLPYLRTPLLHRRRRVSNRRRQWDMIRFQLVEHYCAGSIYISSL